MEKMNDSKFWRNLEKVCCNYTPVMITVCFVSAMLLMYIVDTRYDVRFCTIFYDEFRFYGITASLWKKVLLLFIAGLSVFPYAFTRRGKYMIQHFDSWVKLGLVLGIAIFFYSAVAVMDDIYEFLIKSLDGAEEEVFRFGKPLFVSYAQQNRFILTTPQNILLPLSICMLLLFFEKRQKRNRATTVVCVLLTLLGIRYLNPCILYPVVIWKSVIFFGLALVIGCISSVRRKTKTGGKPKLNESVWYGLLFIGIVMLVICGNIVLMLFLDIFGFYQSVYGLTWFEEITLAVLVFVLMVGLIYAMRTEKLKSPVSYIALKLLPALFLVMIGFAINSFLSGEVYFRGEYSGILKNDLYRLGYHFNYIWFFDCIACLIYVLYVLYDYGMKEHPKLYLGITMFLIIMAYIPNFTIPIGSGIESVSLVNILFGLLSPVLIISFGIINRRKTRELRN